MPAGAKILDFLSPRRL